MGPILGYRLQWLCDVLSGDVASFLDLVDPTRCSMEPGWESDHRQIGHAVGQFPGQCDGGGQDPLMAEEGAATPSSFAALLRRFRRRAALSQEGLAERAGISADAVSALERGIRRAPYAHTRQALAVALELTETERGALEAAAKKARSGPTGGLSLPLERRGDTIPSAREMGDPESPPRRSALLTFLIADFRGYSTYTATHGDEAAAAITARFGDLSDAIVTAHAGAVLELRGDEVMATFSSARQALRAAVELQRRFPLEIGQGTGIELGIGLDAGDAVPVKGGYRTGALNLAARLQTLAHGHVLTSETVVALAGTTPGLAFIDRGPVRVKGRTAPARVYQVVPQAEPPQEIPSLYPPLITPPTNLPDDPTPFIGREDEIDRVAGRLRDPHIRLVTLTGPGGVGKTRLAVQVGKHLLHDFPEGVFFCDLAPLVDPGLVSSALAQVLGVPEQAGKGLPETLIERLGDQHLLLILNNFEHLLGASSVVAQLLDACRDLHILITSRFLLHLTREHEYPLSPLAVPDLSHLPAAEQLTRCESVALFVDRAQAARPDFTLTTQNAPTVAAICAQLDGLPLAIELAAARIRLFPPPALLQRLSNRLTLLTGGPRDAPARQRTVRATLDWSYSLLSPDEQTLFKRLSVFAGGCTFEAAEAVCNAGGDLDVLEGIASLVDKSVLRREGEEGLRFLMLETIREYAAEKLEKRGEATQKAEDSAECFQRRHAEWCVALAETVEPEMTGPASTAAAAKLEREHDNMRTALQWARDGGEIDIALRLAAALWRFWALRGYLTEGRQWLRDALALPAGESMTPSIRVKALAGAARLATDQGAGDEAVRLSDQCVNLARGHEQPSDLVLALNTRGLVERQRDRYREAEAAHAEALGIARDVGDKAGQAASLGGLAVAVGLMGDRNRAEAFAGLAVALLREIEDMQGLADVLLGRALNALNGADYDQLHAFGEEALALFREMGDTGRQAEVLWALGTAAQMQGRHEEAEPWLEESLTLRLERGDAKYAAASRANLGVAALNRGDLVRARNLLEDALAAVRHHDHPWEWAITQSMLGHVELAEGNVERADEMFAESADIFLSIGNPLYVAWALEGLAGVAGAREQWELAARLCGARDALRARIGSGVPPVYEAEYTRMVEAVRVALGEEAFEQVSKTGEEAPLEAIIAEAVPGTRSTPSQH